MAGLVIGSGSTAMALSVTGSVIPIDMFSTTVEKTDLTLDTQDTKIKGKMIDVDIGITNSDGADHVADVTIQLLNATGDVIVEQTDSTGVISYGGGTYSHTFSFQQPDFVDDYAETYIIIEQTS